MQMNIEHKGKQYNLSMPSIKEIRRRRELKIERFKRKVERIKNKSLGDGKVV
jgi:hypothetical protein